MKFPSLRIAAIGLFCLLGIAGTQVSAADYLKSVTHTDGFSMQGMEQPARTDTTVTWLTSDKAAMVYGQGQTFVLRADLNQMFFIDNNKKTYVKIPIDFLGKLDQAIAEAKGDSAAAEAKSQMQNLFDNVNITVDATDSTKKIGKWSTRLYNVTIGMPMGTVHTRSWNTTEVSFDAAMYQSIANAMMASMPGFEKMLAKMTQLKGMTVESTSTMDIGGQQVKTTAKLLDYEEKDPPAGTFDIPDGYTQDTSGAAGMMGGGR